MFHGSFNSRQQLRDYWVPELQKLGEEIIFPEFPIDTWDEVTAAGDAAPLKRQSLDAWLETFTPYVATLNQQKKLVFVGHSSGPLFMLHVLRLFGLTIDAAVFVCPFIDHLTKPDWQVKKVNEPFYFSGFDFEKLRKQCPKSFTLYGTNDPYIETENTLNFAELMNSTKVAIEGGRHLNDQYSGGIVAKYCRPVLNEDIVG